VLLRKRRGVSSDRSQPWLLFRHRQNCNMAGHTHDNTESLEVFHIVKDVLQLPLEFPFVQLHLRPVKPKQGGV